MAVRRRLGALVAQHGSRDHIGNQTEYTYACVPDRASVRPIDLRIRLMGLVG